MGCEALDDLAHATAGGDGEAGEGRGRRQPHPASTLEPTAQLTQGAQLRGIWSRAGQERADLAPIAGQLTLATGPEQKISTYLLAQVQR